MADSQHTESPAVVSRIKRASYLRHVQIHLELLQNSLAGGHFGCGVGQGDRAEIEKRLLEIWHITEAAQLAVVDVRPAAHAVLPQSAQVIPFRPRLAG